MSKALNHEQNMQTLRTIQTFRDHFMSLVPDMKVAFNDYKEALDEVGAARNERDGLLVDVEKLKGVKDSFKKKEADHRAKYEAKARDIDETLKLMEGDLEVLRATKESEVEANAQVCAEHGSKVSKMNEELEAIRTRKDKLLTDIQKIKEGLG